MTKFKTQFKTNFIDRWTKLASGRDAGYFLSTLSRNAYSKARSIVKTLLHNYTLKFDESFGGLGCMEHDSRTITINPLYYLSAVDPIIEKIYASNTPNAWEVVDRVLTWGLIGIVCHEIGHAIYTLPYEESSKLINIQVPEDFIYLCSNIVEDSFVQDKMKQRFRWDLLRDGINTSTAMFQGQITCEEFSNKKEFTVKDKLFYFILKSYNPTYLPPQGLDIPEDLIEEFLSFYFVSDSTDRFLSTLSWCNHAYEWLKDEIKRNPPPPPGGNGPEGGDGPGIPIDGPTDREIEDIIKNIVDDIKKQTNIGSGNDKNRGALKSKDISNAADSLDISLCNGILRVKPTEVKELDSVAKSILASYNLNFRRLQLYSFNGTAYNLSSGSLNKKQLYKTALTPNVFTRDITRKRDMDLYFGITLDASGSMGDTYEMLVNTIVPLIFSLDSIKAKSEMLVFSEETVKVKDYHDGRVSTLYADTLSSNMGQGTDLAPSLRYFSSVIRERQHRDNCVIVVTDGQTGNKEECIELINKLKSNGVCVLGLGLNLDKDCRWFRDLFGDDCLAYPDDDAIRDNVARDLIQYLSSKFMRR